MRHICALFSLLALLLSPATQARAQGWEILFNAGALEFSIGDTVPFKVSTTAVNSLLSLEGSAVNVGTTTQTGSVDVFKGGNASPVLNVGSDADGGSVQVFDNNGDTAVLSAATFGGDGGYFNLVGKTSGLFIVNGDGGASGTPTVTLSGTSATVFDTNLTGDASVVLPTDAVNATEIFGETGAAQSVDGSFTDLTTSFQIMEASTITAPAAGYVLVIGSGYIQADHTNGAEDLANIGVSADCDATPTLPATQVHVFLIPSAAPTGFWEVPFSGQHIFPVSAGANTFCMVGKEWGGEVVTWQESLSLVFIPTAYGSVGQPASANEATVARQGGLTPAEIALEQAASMVANQVRIDRELAEMQARVAELEAELRELRQKKGLQQ